MSGSNRETERKHMRINTLSIGQKLTVIEAVQVRRGVRLEQGQEVTVVGLIGRQSGLSDHRGHTQGVVVAGYPDIFFKASRFGPVAEPVAAAPAVEENAAPVVEEAAQAPAAPETSADATGVSE